MQGTIIMKKPKDFSEGTVIVELVLRGMGAEVEIKLHTIESLFWDDGDLFITTVTAFGKSNWQLRGEELYEPVAVLS